MSAFLGPIHYWLYNKVLWHEALLEDIYAEMKNSDAVASLKNNLEARYGLPETSELSDVIDAGNIHGWLQEKIHSLEYRMAGAITEGLSKEWLSVEGLATLYRNNGEKAALSTSKPMTTPQELFGVIYDYLLEGMPCDRVNQPIESTETSLTWIKRTCLHTEFWEAVGGDIAIYNHLRAAWLEGFVDESFELQMQDASTYILTRRAA